MSVNGQAHLSTFEEVEDEFRAVRVEHANSLGEVMAAIGGLTAETSAVRREVAEVRRVLVEGGLPLHHATDDTGSHMLRETYGQLKALAADPASAMRPRDVRRIVEDVTAEMRLAADAGTWRWIKAQIRKQAAKLVWLALAGGAGYVVHWIIGRH